jgi:hypothetical protein
MSTNRSFQTMLNEYLANDLLKEEMIKRDYMLTNVEKDDGWLGGSLIVPFKAAGASSVSFGGLSASNDIAEDTYTRGSVSTQPEVWGSMIFNHRDLMEHETVSEKNFLKILPDTIDDFLTYMKFVVSVNLLNGAHFAKLTAATSSASGLIVVDHPERFSIGQKVTVNDSNNVPATGYVAPAVGIDMNTKTIKLVTTRGGSTAVDFSANTKLITAKCYNDGAQANSMSSLRDALLSSTNGGSATLYGQTKTAAPYLQAINVDGSSISAANIMEKIFDALTTIRTFGKGNPTDVVMSYRNFGSCLKVIEGSKGAFNVTPGSQKASQYGWTELSVGSIAKGGLKIVGVQELDEDVIMFLDWRALKFYSNGFFRKRKSPDGIEYFEVRATTGYQYIVDVCLFGDLVLLRPSYCGILYSISY